MKVYRITTKKWADRLVASGYPARWNSQGVFTLYSASSRALACLENLVHRDSTALQHLFRVSVIEFPDSLEIETILQKNLPKDWSLSGPKGYSICQPMGDKWNQEKQTLILRVPSVIIKTEYNYLINLSHPDIGKVKITDVEPFLFDDRLGAR